MTILFEYNFGFCHLKEYEMYLPDRTMRAYKLNENYLLNENHLMRFVNKNQPFMVLRIYAGGLYILYDGEVLVVDYEYNLQYVWFKSL